MVKATVKERKRMRIASILKYKSMIEVINREHLARGSTVDYTEFLQDIHKKLKGLGYDKRGKTCGQIVLEENGSKIFDCKNVASAFNRFFTSIASDLVKMLPSPYNLFTSSSNAFKSFESYNYRGRKW